jgi:hypothetical protein
MVGRPATQSVYEGAVAFLSQAALQAPHVSNAQAQEPGSFGLAA